jgi:hypothetical protein
MTERPPRLALWVLLPILAAIALGGEYLGFRLGYGTYALGAPIGAVVIGLAYLAWAAPARGAPTPKTEEEPFDDPVEEAVRADAEKGSSGEPAELPPDAKPGEAAKDRAAESPPA